MIRELFDTSLFWKEVADEFYILVRTNPQFPEIPTNGDIDVLSLFPDAFALRVMTYWPGVGHEVEARNIATEHIQVDVFDLDGRRCAMYDIYSPSSISVKAPILPAFASWSLARRKTRSIIGKTGPFAVWVPNRVDEAIFRYSEYVSAFWTGREKHWHLDWITENLTSDEMREFLQLVHYFARNPRVESTRVGASGDYPSPDPARNFRGWIRVIAVRGASTLPHGFVIKVRSTTFGRWFERRLL